MKKIFLILILSLFTTSSFADGHANANGFSITLKVPMADAAKVEEMLMKHAKWIKETHPLTGEKKLNSYSIMKGPQWKNPGEYIVKVVYGEANISETSFNFVTANKLIQTSDNYEVDAGDSGTFDIRYSIRGATLDNITIMHHYLQLQL